MSATRQCFHMLAQQLDPVASTEVAGVVGTNSSPASKAAQEV
jgi:hypothetical protein